MSDDEEYYDDEFEGDWLWFDEGERELADDLAEGTMHSPVYTEESAIEAILDSASDWDYYTDEYFDDDVSVLHKHSLQSPTGSRGRKQKQGEKQGSDDNIDKGEEEEDHHNSFCRILWRPSGFLVDQGELYEPGNGEKVALLKNWREIFKDSQPKRDYRLQKSASPSLPSASPRVSPQSSTFSKSAAIRKQPGRTKKMEKWHLGAGIGGAVNATTPLDSEGNSEGVSELTGDGDGDGGEDYEDDGGYKTPPPSFLATTQQEIYEKSRKKTTTTGLSRNTSNTTDKGHNKRTGSHLKSVMSASAEEETPELAPAMVSPSSPAASSKQQRSGRLSTAPSTITTAATTTTTTTTQPTPSILRNGKGAMEPGTLLQDTYAESDMADNTPLAGGGGGSPRTHHRQSRKRKASSSPPESADDGDQPGGKPRSKRVATRRRVENGNGNGNGDNDGDDGVGRDVGKNKNEGRIPTTTTRTRRSLRERKK
ncbi:hypothetical protein GX51_03259 [Blastomyces parvus]|uniref:Uncharacterized protein n=1 Tax=Blastomyces parvus TaxID=2060905 RepID=A0A2B7X7V9_9EURO|nr:hypothetical protein GX51_03259 [Blastomyces parvus]